MDIDLDQVFRFKLGDICMHAAMSHAKEICVGDTWMRQWEPHRLLILGRILDECSAGAQRLYTCRAVNHDGNFAAELISMHEAELCPYPPLRAKTEKERELRGKKKE